MPPLSSSFPVVFISIALLAAGLWPKEPKEGSCKQTGKGRVNIFSTCKESSNRINNLQFTLALYCHIMTKQDNTISSNSFRFSIADFVSFGFSPAVVLCLLLNSLCAAPQRFCQNCSVYASEP